LAFRKAKANLLACVYKGRGLYKNAGGVSGGIQSLRWDWIVSTNSGVELAVPKASMRPVASGSKGLGTPNARGQCEAVEADHKGVVLKNAPKQRLTHDFHLMTCVSSSGWLSLYALPNLAFNSTFYSML